MTTGLLSVHAELGVFPTPLPADAFGTSSGIRMDFAGWQDLDRIWADVTVMIRRIPPVTKREARRLPGFSTTTGPSEVTVFPDTLDVTEDTGDGMAALAIAAEIGEETGFVEVAAEIDWLQRPAIDLARAVRLALAAGAHLFARKLAAEGVRLYPDYPELRKMARILAPPQVVNANLPPSPSLQANQTWLRIHANEYKGQWVALRDGSLVAIAPSARELREHLDSTEGLMVTKVF